MSETLRRDMLAQRKLQKRPWHSPPHWRSDRTERYLFTAACFEHQPVIGASRQRLAEFEDHLLSVVEDSTKDVHAWVVLPNHYHFLATTEDPLVVLRALARLHGRTSFRWNGEDGLRGRKVWCGAAETAMKSERHFWATLNYIHHNPVKHGWVKKWQDWPFSSSAGFLEKSGRAEVERLWKEFPIKDYGKGWDD